MSEYNQSYSPELEANLIYGRIVELEFFPVSGNFDIQHLKEIHRRIFQDFSKYVNMPNYQAGNFRNTVDEAETWHKERTAFGKNYLLVYSDMDEKANKLLNETLNKIDTAKLKKLNLKAFVNEISEIYSIIDYIHPFNDGNSRTLRTFTRQLAKESSYDLAWEKLDKERLYLSRDISVHKIAVKQQLGGSKQAHQELVLRYIDDGKDLSCLLKNIITFSKDKSPKIGLSR